MLYINGNILSYQMKLVVQISFRLLLFWNKIYPLCRDEPIYPNLDSFLNQPEHADLPGIQDGYSLAISEFLGSDISRCPSVPSDLNNLQTGMSLDDAEVLGNYLFYKSIITI